VTEKRRLAPSRLSLLISILSVFTMHAFAEPPRQARIVKLSPSDLVFRQLQDSISQGYKAEKSGARYPDLFICYWDAVEGDDIFSLAARLSLPYETLATLNGLAQPRFFKAGERILIPSIAGIFVPDMARNDFDLILAARLGERSKESVHFIASAPGGDRAFTFFPGARLYQTERSFFLEIGFRMPLPEGILTSSYGWRSSPIDGHDRMHSGIDLSAPHGTPVLAARDGVVVAVGTDAVLGVRVIIEHDGGLKTVYGHLKSASVVLNQSVRSGTIIGAVGSTGLSTGPHLHFEIRLSDKTRDPSAYIPGLKP
jgi:murein DD-endopeptidase MepM/ murein hydrolase activator NlpD